ncbi:hypothetical protein [Sulfuricurvum sp.]|uniref:hypothetical protein n=1 Tax=Sulfuricurvum sp. TaxID=2025608 RepID=UPI0035683C30
MEFKPIDFFGKPVNSGDLVQIVEKKYGHGFEFFELAEVTRVTNHNFLITGKNDFWYLHNEEIVRIGKI